jgi:hypothetical protein
LHAALVLQPGSCIRRLGGTRAREMRFTRLLRNDSVTAEEMSRHAGTLTGGRAAGRDVVAIQDTSELALGGRRAALPNERARRQLRRHRDHQQEHVRINHGRHSILQPADRRGSPAAERRGSHEPVRPRSHPQHSASAWAGPADRLLTWRVHIESRARRVRRFSEGQPAVSAPRIATVVHACLDGSFPLPADATTAAVGQETVTP